MNIAHLSNTKMDEFELVSIHPHRKRQEKHAQTYNTMHSWGGKIGWIEFK